MKSRIVIFLLSLIFISSVSAQSLDKFFPKIHPVEQRLQQLGMNGKIGGLTSSQFQQAFFKGQILIDPKTAQRMQLASKVLEDYVIAQLGSTVNSAADVLTTMTGMGVPISPAEAQIIYNHIAGGGPKPGINAHVFLLSLLAKKGFAKLLALIQEQLQMSQRPSRPDSPSSRSIKRVINRGMSLQQVILPKPKISGDWFGNAYTSLNASYTTYEDRTLNGSGREEAFSLSVGGDIGANTSLSFSLATQRNHLGGENQTTSKTFGGDLLIHHKLNEHFGVGAYGFYQKTDIEDSDGDVFGHGGGLLLSGFYDFGIVDISTIQTFNKVWYKYGNDQLYVGTFRVNRNWTDWFSSAFTASYIDSLKSDQIGDNSYWTVGGDVTFTFSENATLILGYERTVSLKDYTSNTFNASFIWTF